MRVRAVRNAFSEPAIPRTPVLGAIVITGFVRGALATHFRISETLVEPQIVNTLLGIGAWGGIWLRDPRLRAPAASLGVAAFPSEFQSRTNGPCGGKAFAAMKCATAAPFVSQV